MFTGSLPYPVKVVIAGNHDLTFDDDLVRADRSMLTYNFGVTKECKFNTILNV